MVGDHFPYEGSDIAGCADWCKQQFEDEGDNTNLYLSTCPEDYWPEFTGFQEESCQVSGYEGDELRDCVFWCVQEGVGVTCGGDYTNHLYIPVCEAFLADEDDVSACLNYCITQDVDVDECEREFRDAGCPGTSVC